MSRHSEPAWPEPGTILEHGQLASTSETDSYVNVSLSVAARRLRRPPHQLSNAATVASITNAAISAVPSKIVASPSPVICHTITEVPNSAPM